MERAVPSGAALFTARRTVFHRKLSTECKSPERLKPDENGRFFVKNAKEIPKNAAINWQKFIELQIGYKKIAKTG